MNKMHTGIKGFDELVGGGLPVGKTILLSGTPGTGKTIFCLEFIYRGAVKYKQKGLYVSFEENAKSLKSQASVFGWDFDRLEKEGLARILTIPISELKETTVHEIIAHAREKNIQRLVIDSLSAISINTPSKHAKAIEVTELYTKRFVYSFVNELRTLDTATTILISQTTDGQLSRDTVSEFVCDGIILLTHESLGGDYARSLRIRKMREVKNNEDLHPLEINRNGIWVHSLE